MRVKLQKSVISAYDYKTHEDLPTEGIRYNRGGAGPPPGPRKLPVPQSARGIGREEGSIGPGTMDDANLFHHRF
jgi:hypothetical protein